MSKFKYEPPTLTRYGKPSEFIEAGSVILASGDVTGDGVIDDLFDTNNDGVGDVVVGGANGGQTPVTFVGTFFGLDIYDGPDGDALGGLNDSGSLNRNALAGGQPLL